MTLLEYQDKLVQTYGYKLLPDKIRWQVRRVFVKHLPAPFFDYLFTGFEGYPLFSKAGNCISRGFSRVVVGDYGAFIEIAPSLIFPESLEILHGTEKRLEFQNAKYLWMCPVSSDGEQDRGCKVYNQLKSVAYADYRPNMYYVSPFHLQYASDDELPSESEVELVIGQLKQQELERVGFQQLTLF